MTDLRERGLSLDRLAYTDEPGLRQRAESMAARAPDRRAAGFGRAQCEAIRSLVDVNGVRALCVLDTALPDNTAHADAIASNRQSESALRGVRGRLIELFEPIEPFSGDYTE